ncbi:hypothetical protein OK32_002701 [Salmonella enterica subsp. enterica]|nr:hypothetical protein [Salmonella enterica subsp. diarizonae]EEJ7165574.1 hypothetical protein [Salmonella enterica subsp. enterica serovar Hvittingfoss]
MQEIHVKPASVTTEEFIDFIERFEGSPTCPICHSQSWEVQGEVRDLDAGEPFGRINIIESLNYAVIDNGVPLAAPGGLPVFRVTCTTCAYMMLFSYRRIRVLIDEQRKSQDLARKEGEDV